MTPKWTCKRFWTICADESLPGHFHFKHLFQAGPLERGIVEWLEVLKDAHQISAALATRYKARSADVLHVAILEQINPDVFVTFDQDQSVLAIQRGFAAHLIR